MLISRDWLNEWVAVKADTKTLAEQLVSAGLEVENLQDQNIDLKITPNRGDCLSVLGVAREIASLNNLTPPKFNPSPVITEIETTKIPIILQAPQACPKYCSRVIKNIDSKAPTPDFILKRLKLAGINSNLIIVDILNYIMLAIGQPMHAFDLQSCLSGIIVRYAEPEEKIILLKNIELKLNSTDLVIANQQSETLALAGIMGGLDSAIKPDTTDILLESAYFDPVTIRLSASKYKLNSDASYRYARGVDPELSEKALDLATELICKYAGKNVKPEISSQAYVTEYLPKPKIIKLRVSQVSKILGCEIELDKIINILNNLSIKILEKNQTQNYIIAQPPSFRFDLSLEIDLIEEIARIYGYNNLPSYLPETKLEFKNDIIQAKKIIDLKNILVHNGFNEAINYSFLAPKILEKYGFKQSADLVLSNPINIDLSIMRPSLIPGLIENILNNQDSHHIKHAKLFEVGVCFTPEEKNKIGIALFGSQNPEQWAQKPGNIDFYDLKFACESIIPKYLKNKIIWRQDKEISLYLDQQLIGMAKNIENIWVAEIDLDYLLDNNLPKFNSFSKYPAVRRDLALIIKQDISAQEIINFIKKISSNILHDIFVFDVYQGQHLEAGHKSLAIGLIFQNLNRTLVEAEVSDQIDIILRELENKFGAKLRF